MKRVPEALLGLALFFSPQVTSANPSPEEIAAEIQESSKQELHRLFQVRNHKGETVLKKKRALEAGIWATRDPVRDKVEGTSTDLLYREFRIRKKGTPVVVAVIDTGVDISHPELRNKLWTNEVELHGKPGVDDDGDGYIDDIYGWNFIGSRDGRNLKESNLEMARIYSSLKKKQAQGIVSPSEQLLFEKVRTSLHREIENTTRNQIRYEAFANAIRLLKSKGLASESLDSLASLSVDDPETTTAIALARTVFSHGLTLADLEETLEYFRVHLRYHLNPAFDPSALIGDNPENLNERGYGNPDVTGPDPLHGTHVAGIIAADRENDFGIEGQARNVKIMALRAVPDGDERDKDVANAIRFAVDHGAQIINMSFGKDDSPEKSAVDEAVLYAESRGVLLIHAAGNDGLNTETDSTSHPTRNLILPNGRPRVAQTWIEVGASGPSRDHSLAASFSNYGKSSVDLFAPGVKIVSTAPGNHYASLEGTSMASPQVAGIAALLLGKKPSATALEIKTAILSGVNLYPDLVCDLPGSTGDKDKPPIPVPFSSLSGTGGTANAREALRWLLAH